MTEMSPEKSSELWQDYYRLRGRMIEICQKHSNMTCDPSWTDKACHRTLVVDCLLGKDAEKSSRAYSAYIAAILQSTHFICKKGYVYREGIIRFWLAPDWRYYLGNEYVERMDKKWVLPPPGSKAVERRPIDEPHLKT